MIEAQKESSSEAYDDELELLDLIRILWEGKWLFVGIAAVATVIAIIVALMLPNIYRADVLLAPNARDGAAGLSALAAQYGSLASLAGIQLGGDATDQTVIGLEILRSRRFISDFIERHDILVPLMAAKGWDQETGELVIDPSAYHAETGTWVREVPEGKSPVPTSLEAVKAFRDVLSVSQDRRSGVVAISIEHYSPEIAKQWVDWLISDLNSTIMHQDVAEAEQAIEYLNKQIEKTSVAALQNMFFRLIEEQTKTVMLANVSREYLLKTLDPAVVPEQKARPSRRLIVILGMILGGLCGIAAVGMWNWKTT